MRRRLFALGCAGLGLTAGTVALAGCGANAAGLCDFGECSPQDGGQTLDAFVPRDGTIGPEASVGPEGGEDGGADSSDDTGPDATPSCGADANVAYCGEDAGCVDTTSAVANCGTCGNACPGPDSGLGTGSCLTGTCGIACGTNDFPCDGDCHSKSAPPTDPCVVTESFGVFVSVTGSDAPGKGTRAAPYATIGYAMQNAGGVPRVYVCAGTYPGAISVAASAPALAVYGGFSCASATTWTYAPANDSVKIQPTTGVPLSIASTTTALTFENIEFDAPNATTAGGSSIGAEVSGATGAVAFVGCTFNAGTGATGALGTTPTTALPIATPGVPADTLTNNGGSAADCPCPYGVDSVGASGGTGGVSPLAGGSGQPGSGDNDGTAGSPTAACGNATKGADGTPVGGNSAGATTIGLVSGSAWTPSAGTIGPGGATAQGGGGGGGGFAAVGLGNGGGGGGCGGCGGGGGGAGGGGGGSIGALVIGSPSVTFTACVAKTLGGGGGGGGAAGQVGAGGGGRGNGTTTGDGCAGGVGGAGGQGGTGGGGAGGISAGVAWQGSTAPTLDSATTTATTLGAVGAKGTGGDPGVNDGIAGTSGALLKLLP